MESNLLILKRADVETVLSERQSEISDCVRDAYLEHDVGRSVLPHSVFLRFPNSTADRIIALPAYLDRGIAGIKWVSSFPGNDALGLERASAIVVLNSVKTGFPEAILEASAINLCRTAASAALAAKTLALELTTFGIVGAGPVAFETLSFLNTLEPTRQKEVRVYDLDASRAQEFVHRATEQMGQTARIVAVPDLKLAVENPLVLFATSASAPFVSAPTPFLPGTTVLHISLRDLDPSVLLECRNIVDDVEHVNREDTSVHLASKLGNLTDSFVAGTLADVLSGRIPPRVTPDDVVIFSPFGLGVLDIALSHFVISAARQMSLGEEIAAFSEPATK